MAIDKKERRASISEAFHSLNQPITSLHCILELALARPRSPEEYRQRIAEALENAGAVLRLARALREVVEAEDAGENAIPVQLHDLLKCVVNQIEALAELRGCAVSCSAPLDATLIADQLRLKRAIVYVCEALLYEAAPGQRINLQVTTSDTQATITVSADAQQVIASKNSLDERLASMHWSTAVQTVHALGGSLQGEEDGARRTYEIRLPLAAAGEEAKVAVAAAVR